MPAFEGLDPEQVNRLDWQILQNGAISLYIDHLTLEEACQWFHKQQYALYRFDCREWKTEQDFHLAISQVLDFPDYYGHNLDAFNDCLLNLDIPPQSGCVLVFFRIDLFAQRFPRFTHQVLDIIEAASRSFLLTGQKLIALVQSDDPAFSFEPVGVRPVTLNPKEYLNKIQPSIRRLAEIQVDEEQRSMWLASFCKGYERVHDREPEKEEIAAFVTRWGALNLKTFAYVLTHGEDDDRKVALCTLGCSDDPEALALLEPYLYQSQPQDRWLSALFLGQRKDERARPVLETMLTEFLPTSISPLPVPNKSWFDSKRMWVVKTLAQWNDPRLVSVLRHGFIESMKAEPYQPSDFFREYGYRFQDRLMYQLGEWSAFGVLVGLELPPPHLHIAVVQLAVGACHFDTFFQRGLWHTEEPLRKQVASLLEKHFGLSEEEQNQYIETHRKDPRGKELKETPGRMKFTEFLERLRETWGLTPKEAMNILNVKNLNRMDYNKALEQLQQHVRDEEIRSE